MPQTKPDLTLPILIGPDTSAENVFEHAGRVLRLAREWRGLSQEELAISCNYDQSSLSKVERRGLNYASPARIKQILSELGLCVFLGSSASQLTEMKELYEARSWKALLQETLKEPGTSIRLEFRELTTST